MVDFNNRKNGGMENEYRDRHARKPCQITSRKLITEY